MNSPVFVPSQVIPSPVKFEQYDEFRELCTPIIIDNGSSTLRWGFASRSFPYLGSNVVAKYKERRTNKPLLLFGEGVEVESGTKAQARSPWEGDILLNFDALENALDYVFTTLGINTGSVNHPILMSERLCMPSHSRALTSELMFELYSVPSLAYCVDGIMSFYRNNFTSPFLSSGLVLSFNSSSTSIIPIIGGKGILSKSKRIPWGSSQASDYLLKLIQLKYPTFPTRVTFPQSNWMLQNFCEFAIDYPILLRTLKDPVKLREIDRIVQFPFVPLVSGERTEEEANRLAEKRREQGKKLQEIAAKNRMGELDRKESDLQYLSDLREERHYHTKQEWMNKLRAEGIDDDTVLNDVIKALENGLKKARKKEFDNAADNTEVPSFPLANVPDDELDEVGLKEKKKQKFLRANFEARARIKREKERREEQRKQDEEKDEDERNSNRSTWSQRIRKEQKVLMDKIKDRARRKAALGDRKSAAAQARMKSIANLASDERVSKKKKGSREDVFGADDEDWAIYRRINPTTVSSDEEEDLERLAFVESKLLAHDPTFTMQQTFAFITTQPSSLVSAFRPLYDESDLKGKARLHLNVERWRACETYFSPNLTGVDSAGLGEVIQNVLACFSIPDRMRLANNIFLTGSPSLLPGLTPRLQATLRPNVLTEIAIHIFQASDACLDAWKGMASFASTAEFRKVQVTRQEYEEYGGEWIKRWWGGNCQ